MKDVIRLFSMGVLAVGLALAFYPSEVTAGCDLKKSCWFKDGCKDKVGGCCLGPAECGNGSEV